MLNHRSRVQAEVQMKRAEGLRPSTVQYTSIVRVPGGTWAARGSRSRRSRAAWATGSSWPSTWPALCSAGCCAWPAPTRPTWPPLPANKYAWTSPVMQWHRFTHTTIYFKWTTAWTSVGIVSWNRREQKRRLGEGKDRKDRGPGRRERAAKGRVPWWPCGRWPNCLWWRRRGGWSGPSPARAQCSCSACSWSGTCEARRRCRTLSAAASTGCRPPRRTVFRPATSLSPRCPSPTRHRSRCYIIYTVE